METSSLKFDLKFDYNSLTLPDKIIIPIEDGTFGPLQYKQNDTDPLAIEQLKLGYAGPDQVQLHLRVTGRIAVNNFPDLKLGGTYLTIQAALSLQDKILYIKTPTLTHVDLPSIPDFADDFIEKIINKNILAQMADNFSIDLTASFVLFEKTMNAPIPLNVSVLAEKQEYTFDLNGTLGDPVLHVLPENLHCAMEMEFTPTLEAK